LVANGHSWLSIKKYTLSEIGIFYKTVILMERESKAENISNLWMGNNLAYEGLKDVLKNFGIKPQKKVEPSVAEVNKDWSKLANFMSGRK